MKKITVIIFLAFLLLSPVRLFAQVPPSTSGYSSSTPAGLTVPPTDTQLKVLDSDGDGYTDGREVQNGYDPNKNGNDKLDKIYDF